MTRIVHPIARLGVGLVLILFGAASSAEATSIVITNVSVLDNGVTYNSGNVGWSFPVTLAPGQDLVLTQNFQGPPNSTTSYNFDTSDNPNTAAPTSPQITVTSFDGVASSTTVFS